MDKKRLAKLAGIQLNEARYDMEQKKFVAGEDRRSADRSQFSTTMQAFRDHMFQIKRHLAKGNIEKAEKLVDGAISAFEKMNRE